VAKAEKDRRLKNSLKEEHTVRGSITPDIIQKAQYSCRGSTLAYPLPI